MKIDCKRNLGGKSDELRENRDVESVQESLAAVRDFMTSLTHRPITPVFVRS